MREIAVIIPTKDRLLYLKRAVELYLKQSIVGEVIIVIDGSTDGTREFLEKRAVEDSRLVIIDNGRNRGIPYSRNAGIAAASCPYIFSTEDDLEITESFLPTLLEHLKRGGDIASGRNIFRRDTETAEQAINRTNKLQGDPIDMHSIEINTNIALPKDTRQLLIASPMLGRREVFQRVRFDERYKVNFWREETDFQLSAQEAGYTLLSCPHALCFNFVIHKDRSGVHAAIGLKRTTWVVINNWRFITKHRMFIQHNFAIGNPYIYITIFALRRAAIDCVLPFLIALKQKLRHASFR